MTLKTINPPLPTMEYNRGLPQVNPRSLFTLDPLQDQRWRTLIAKHPASSVFHSWEWLSALRAAYGYEPVVYTMCEPSAELTSGVLFCKVRSWFTGSRLVSLPFSDHCDPLVDSADELDSLLLPVKESVDRREWDYCEVRPVRFEPGAATQLEESNRYLWHIIDLRPDINTIFDSLHHSVRRKIRRAEREQLTYEEGNSELLLKQFYELVVSTRRRQHLPPQPLHWFRSVLASLGDKVRIRVAYKAGIPIASILTLSHKKTLTYKYGCSKSEMHPLGGVAMVFWNTIRQAKASGYEALDLGRTDSANSGLITFKQRLGGIPSELSYRRYPNRPEFRPGPLPRRILDQVVRVAPDWALIAAGNLFYRHIG